VSSATGLPDASVGIQSRHQQRPSPSGSGVGEAQEAGVADHNDLHRQTLRLMRRQPFQGSCKDTVHHTVSVVRPSHRKTGKLARL
jgi:hypothetical protein